MSYLLSSLSSGDTRDGWTYRSVVGASRSNSCMATVSVEKLSVDFDIAAQCVSGREQCSYDVPVAKEPKVLLV